MKNKYKISPNKMENLIKDKKSGGKKDSKSQLQRDFHWEFNSPKGYRWWMGNKKEKQISDSPSFF